MQLLYMVHECARQLGQFCDLPADLRSSTCFHDPLLQQHIIIYSIPLDSIHATANTEVSPEDLLDLLDRRMMLMLLCVLPLPYTNPID